ncbi:MFS transporter [Clavibacter sp. DM3]|nr:MFS transporter [Clavibacter zhangzhiyongii]
MMAVFTMGIPVALVLGTPLSGLLLELEGLLGLHGWQWMYIIEGVPALVIAGLILWLLPKDLASARFLAPEERAWLVERLAAERRETEAKGVVHGFWRSLLNPVVLVFAIAYYGLTNLNGAISTYLPQIMQSFGLENTPTTFIAAIPYAFGLGGMILFGRYADRAKRRSDAVYVALGVAVVGLVASALAPTPLFQLVTLCVASVGVFGVLPTFWGIPTALMGGVAAAGSIAFINAFGNIASIVNPAVIGAIRESTGSFEGGLLWLAGMAVVAVIGLTVALRIVERRRRADAATAGIGAVGSGGAR